MLNRNKRKKRDKDYPKRKLSAYNLFFRDERKAILSHVEGLHSALEAEDEDDSDDALVYAEESDDALKCTGGEHCDDRNTSQTDSHPNPSEEEQDETNTAVSSNPVDAATAATAAAAAASVTSLKLSFQEMAKTIGARWKALDPERIKYYQKLAELEVERYEKEMNEYRETQKKLMIWKDANDNSHLNTKSDNHSHNSATVPSMIPPSSALFSSASASMYNPYMMYNVLSNDVNNIHPIQRLLASAGSSTGMASVPSGGSSHSNTNNNSSINTEYESLLEVINNPFILSSLLTFNPNSTQDRLALIFKLQQLHVVAQQREHQIQLQFYTALQYVSNINMFLSSQQFPVGQTHEKQVQSPPPQQQQQQSMAPSTNNPTTTNMPSESHTASSLANMSNSNPSIQPLLSALLLLSSQSQPPLQNHVLSREQLLQSMESWSQYTNMENNNNNINNNTNSNKQGNGLNDSRPTAVAVDSQPAHAHHPLQPQTQTQQQLLQLLFGTTNPK